MISALLRILLSLALLLGEYTPISGLPVPRAETHEITLSFLGDLLLSTMPGRYGGRDFWHCADQTDPAWFLEGLGDVLKNDYCTFGNLENVLSDRTLTPIEKGYSPAYWYQSPTRYASILREGGVDVLSLSNNHAGDYGSEGREDTKKALEAEGLRWGDSSTTVHLYPYTAHIAVLCCVLPTDGSCEAALRWLRSMREQSDFQIIYFHGGASMYDHLPDESLLSACRRLVDEGADLVVGHHPHVLQQVTYYRGVLIAPSLGAVIFGDGQPENAGAILQVTLSVREQTVTVKRTEFLPFRLWENARVKWHPTLLEGEEKNRVLAFLEGRCDSPVA